MPRLSLFLFFSLAIACLAQTNHEIFSPLHHSGAASPYFDAPDQFGISALTPAGCRVDQAAYIVRHGSRYPEPGSFAGWQTLFAKFQNASYTAHGPLAFIPSWVPPIDNAPHEPLFLSSTGSGEAFDLGVQLRKRYGLTPGGENFTVWAGGQQRVVDTASYFLRGYLSQGNYLTTLNLNRGTVVSLPDSVNYTFADSLTPSNACPLYETGDTGAASATSFRATFQQKIADRLNNFLDGLTLDPTDIGVMQDLCGFSAEINSDTRFCDVFEDSEWLDYEYAHDLNYYYGSGPGNPFSATTGFPWIKSVSDLFDVGPNKTTVNGTFIPPPLIMGFTHDNDLPPIISALGLWNASATPLSHTKPNSKRNFRSSYLVSFRGYVALEKLICSGEIMPGQSVRHIANQLGGVPNNHTKFDTKAYVRVRVNNAPVPIPNCSSGPGSTCPLKSFTTYINQQRARATGDFVQKCGITASNATSAITFLTKVPGTTADANLVLLSVPN